MFIFIYEENVIDSNKKMLSDFKLAILIFISFFRAEPSAVEISVFRSCEMKKNSI